jgi:hypothetical protein
LLNLVCESIYGMARLRVMDVRDCGGWYFHWWPIGKGFVFCVTNLTSGKYLDSVYYRKHADHISYWPARSISLSQPTISLVNHLLQDILDTTNRKGYQVQVKNLESRWRQGQSFTLARARDIKMGPCVRFRPALACDSLLIFFVFFQSFCASFFLALFSTVTSFCLFCIFFCFQLMVVFFLFHLFFLFPFNCLLLFFFFYVFR